MTHTNLIIRVGQSVIAEVTSVLYKRPRIVPSFLETDHGMQYVGGCWMDRNRNNSAV